jgi:tetrahydrodipicolinate N-succinyltransferase
VGVEVLVFVGVRVGCGVEVGEGALAKAAVTVGPGTLSVSGSSHAPSMSPSAVQPTSDVAITTTRHQTIPSAQAGP